jgi:Fic family protein
MIMFFTLRLKMKSFEPGFLERQLITPILLTTIRELGEFKGKQQLYKEQAPQVLRTLLEAAVIQSTESSNRIEGVTAPPERIRQLVAHRTEPRNRSEQEIAGYRDVLQTIHTRHPYVPFRVGVVLQFHRDLYQFQPGMGGRWKTAANEIMETRPDGTTFVRFHTVPPHQTAEAMERLHARFSALWDEGRHDPLLLIPAYVLDFLCIHPFLDGNGRMGRLLTLLLLYHAGYEVGRYISLEHVVEQTRDGYYGALYSSSQGWHQGEHSLLPWWEYFLGVMLRSAYREFERRVGVVATARGAKRDLIYDVIDRLPARFRFADVERACPGISRPTINRALAGLRRAGRIGLSKSGRDATWEKLPRPESGGDRDHDRLT